MAKISAILCMQFPSPCGGRSISIRRGNARQPSVRPPWPPGARSRVLLVVDLGGRVVVHSLWPLIFHGRAVIVEAPAPSDGPMLT